LAVISHNLTQTFLLKPLSRADQLSQTIAVTGFQLAGEVLDRDHGCNPLSIAL
jgi:hypothetical protein